MAGRITKRTKAVLSSGLHPHYVSVAKTMAQYTGDTLDTALPDLSAKTDSVRLLDAIDGDDFRHAVEKKFGLDLSGRPTMTTLRGKARSKDGQIHTDSKTKMVTVLLYLNRSKGEWDNHAGCLRLLNGPESLDDYAAEVPPVDGTVLVFPCVPNAWHGHEPFDGERRVIQLNWVTDQGVVEREQKRHAVSAFFKGILPARM